MQFTPNLREYSVTQQEELQSTQAPENDTQPSLMQEASQNPAPGPNFHPVDEHSPVHESKANETDPNQISQETSNLQINKTSKFEFVPNLLRDLFVHFPHFASELSQFLYLHDIFILCMTSRELRTQFIPFLKPLVQRHFNYYYHRPAKTKRITTSKTKKSLAAIPILFSKYYFVWPQGQSGLGCAFCGNEIITNQYLALCSCGQYYCTKKCMYNDEDDHNNLFSCWQLRSRKLCPEYYKNQKEFLLLPENTDSFYWLRLAYLSLSYMIANRLYCGSIDGLISYESPESFRRLKFYMCDYLVKPCITPGVVLSIYRQNDFSKLQ